MKAEGLFVRRASICFAVAADARAVVEAAGVQLATCTDGSGAGTDGIASLPAHDRGVEWVVLSSLRKVSIDGSLKAVRDGSVTLDSGGLVKQGHGRRCVS